jgi:pyruvate dehydrogenase E1 component alpha subunit
LNKAAQLMNQALSACFKLKVDGMTKKRSGGKKSGFILISDERLVELYRAMVHCRLVNDLPDGKTHARKEALAAGVLLHLRKEDRVILAAHNRAHRLLKGEKLEHLLRHTELNAQGGLIPIDENSSGAQQVMLAAGVAMALKAVKGNSATIVFIEGNQTAGKEWGAALKFVVKHKLGLILVCYGSAAQKPGKSRTLRNINLDEPGARSAVKGLPPALQVDGSDCIAVYRVMQEALTHAREGSRPTVIRAFGTKDLSSAEGIATEDPIARMETYLRSKNLLPRKLQKSILSEFKTRLKLATSG